MVTPPPAAPASKPATSRHAIDCRLAYELDGPCDFIFMIQVAEIDGQRVIDESLTLSPKVEYHTYADDRSGNRFLRLRAEAGTLEVRYRATVDLSIAPRDVNAAELSIDELPDDVLHNLMPTRYCESDLLSSAAVKMFGNLPPGYARVQAISDWIHDNIEYKPGSTNATTTSRDVFVQRAGVCRDYAHLGVTFCRALNIPARLVCGYTKFDEPPPDFHAVFEAYLGGRWVSFDPTQMVPIDTVVRIATGRDAKDVAFASIFGPARMTSLAPEVDHVGESTTSNRATESEPA